MTYTNQQTFRCLLGPHAKDVSISDNLFLWRVGKIRHFAVDGPLTPQSIEILKSYCPANFHYVDKNNLTILKQHFDLSRTKSDSAIIDLQDLSFSGNKYKDIRHCINRCKKENFTHEDNYRKIEDVIELRNEWSELYTDNYFRDLSAKNVYFYKNNFHLGALNLFLYKEDKLVSYGTLSTPIDGYCVYIIGKSLFKRHYGLSEYCDVELYQIATQNGAKFCNMGGSFSKGVLAYKTKFNHTIETDYDGTIKSLKNT